MSRAKFGVERRGRAMYAFIWRRDAARVSGSTGRISEEVLIDRRGNALWPSTDTHDGFRVRIGHSYSLDWCSSDPGSIGVSASISISGSGTAGRSLLTESGAVSDE